MDVKIEYKLWEYRTSKGISSRKLAQLSGISKSTINNIENNRYDPTIRTLCMLAKALETTPETLYSYKFIP